MTTVPDTLLDGIDRTRPLTGPQIRAAEVVYEAIAATGTGEAWSVYDDRLPDAVKVGARLILVETDADACGRPADLGWLLTVFAGEEPAAVHVELTRNAAFRRLVSLMRKPRPAWHRERPGLYRSGPHFVEQTQTGEWYASASDCVFDTKAAAQEASR